MGACMCAKAGRLVSLGIAIVKAADSSYPERYSWRLPAHPAESLPAQYPGCWMYSQPRCHLSLACAAEQLCRAYFSFSKSTGFWVRLLQLKHLICRCCRDNKCLHCPQT